MVLQKCMYILSSRLLGNLNLSVPPDFTFGLACIFSFRLTVLQNFFSLEMCSLPCSYPAAFWEKRFTTSTKRKCSISCMFFSKIFLGTVHTWHLDIPLFKVHHIFLNNSTSFLSFTNIFLYIPSPTDFVNCALLYDCCWEGTCSDVFYERFCSWNRKSLDIFWQRIIMSRLLKQQWWWYFFKWKGGKRIIFVSPTEEEKRVTNKIYFPIYFSWLLSLSLSQLIPLHTHTCSLQSRESSQVFCLLQNCKPFSQTARGKKREEKKV